MSWEPTQFGHEGERIAVDVRPATRVGRELIFEGGECRRMGLLEYALIKVGIKRTVARATRRES